MFLGSSIVLGFSLVLELVYQKGPNLSGIILIKSSPRTIKWRGGAKFNVTGPVQHSQNEVCNSVQNTKVYSR